MKAVLYKNGRPYNGEQFVITSKCMDDVISGELKDLGSRVHVVIEDGEALRRVLCHKKNLDKTIELYP